MARVLVTAILVVLLAACSGPGAGTTVTGSGHLVSRQFDLDGFSQIDADSGAQVDVTRGGAFSVNVETDDNVAPLLDLSVASNTLRIRVNADSVTNVTVLVKVTMPKLTGVTLNGGSSLVGELEGEGLTVSLNGGSHITLSGTAGGVAIDTNGGSQAMLGDLAAEDVELNADGGSIIEINASGRVSGLAKAGSQIIVTGSPSSVEVETESGAQVNTR